MFDVVLVAFGLERLVYRLSVSEYRDRFVLKGGMLVTLWTGDTGRFTRDIDFLAFGSDEETQLKEAFSAILAIDGRDGLIYDTANLTAVAIREDQVYGGMRLRTIAFCLTRHGMLHMMFKLAQCAETSWRKLRGFAHLADVIEGVDFINGIKPSTPDRAAA